MFCPLLLFLCQTGVHAGSAQASCDGSVVTLWARPLGDPANYLIQWENASSPGVFLVVTPPVTTSYRVFLTDLDTSETYEHTTQVLVHPGNSDLDNNGQLDGDDWNLFYSQWGMLQPGLDLDPDQDNRTTVLDWFYFCNFDLNPPNTPPSLSVSPAFTTSGDSVVVDYLLDDLEQTPALHIGQQPQNGFVTFISGVLRYSPDTDFVGNDSFSLYASDGYLQTPDLMATVGVLAPDTYTNLRTDIFDLHCEACHLNGVTSGGLQLDTFAQAQAGGNNGPAFVPGLPGSSPLYLRVVSGEMPLNSPPLSLEEVERIRLWIVRGAMP